MAEIEDMLKQDFPQKPDPPNPPGGDPPPPPNPPEDGDDDPVTKDFVTKHFEGFPSLKVVKERLTAVKDLPIEKLPEIMTKASSFDTVKGEFDEYKKKIETHNPYDGDDDLYRYFEIKKKSPEDAKIYLSLVQSNLAPLEIIKIKLLSEHPELKEKPDVLNRKIQRMFGGLFGADGQPPDTTSPAYQEAMDDLELEANAYKRSFIAKYNEIKVPTKFDPEATKKEQEAAQSKLLESWKAPLQMAKSSLKTLAINVFVDKDKEGTVMDYPLTDEQQIKILANAARYALQKGLQPDQNGMNEAIEFAKGLFEFENRKIIYASLADTVSKNKDTEWRKTVFNPGEQRGPRMPEGPPGKKTGVEQSEDIFKQIVK